MTVEAVQSGTIGPTRKRAVRYGVTLALAIATVVWLVLYGGGKHVATSLAQAQLGWFLLALCVYLAGQVLCAWKWRLLAQTLGFHRPAGFYYVTYLGAMFPALFLPASIGGDVVRAASLTQAGRDGARATVSVLADRGTGGLALVWIATVALSLSPLSQRLPGVMAALCGLCAALTVAFLIPFGYRPEASRWALVRHVMACWKQPRVLLAALVLGFLFQLADCAVHVLLGQALGLPIAPVFYFVLCPLAAVASMSPVTLGGLGERAAAPVLLLTSLGVREDLAVAYGLANSALMTLAALCGGGVLLVAGATAATGVAVDAPREDEA